MTIRYAAVLLLGCALLASTAFAQRERERHEHHWSETYSGTGGLSGLSRDDACTQAQRAAVTNASMACSSRGGRKSDEDMKECSCSKTSSGENTCRVTLKIACAPF